MGKEGELTRTGWKVVRMALLALAIGVAGLSAGCSGSNKNDGQIESAPEARNAAAAVNKSYMENMIKQHAKPTNKKQ